MAEQCNFTFHGDEETDGPRTVDGGNRDENGGDTSGLSRRGVILRAGREELLVMNEKSGQGKKELLASRIPLIERNIELMTGYSVELVNDGSLRLGLLCVCCKKIARDAMQTSIGHRICEPCSERIKKYICVHACLYACVCTNLKYTGTSLLGTLWYLNFSPYYRGFHNSEVILYITVLHWDKEWCPYYRGFHISEVCNREVPLYYVIDHKLTYILLTIIIYLSMFVKC